MYDNDIKEKILYLIKKNINGRKLLIWGAWQRGQELANYIKDNGIDIYGYIDSAKYDKTYHSQPVFNPATINPKNHYVLVSLIEHAAVFQTLENIGCKENTDYCYADKKISIIYYINSYEDIMGNRIHGGTVSLQNKNSEIILSGASLLEIEKNIKIGKNVKIILDWNSHIFLGTNVTLEDNCTLVAHDESTVIIENGCHIRHHNTIKAKNHSHIQISSNTSIAENSCIHVSNHNTLTIGKNCRIAYYVKIRSGNGHAIVNMDTNEIQNNRKDIHIGDNVWIGMGVTILGGARLGSHSIIGADSLVNKEVQEHCLMAGNPCKIIREHVDWCMKDDITWEEYLEESGYN